MPTYAKEHNLSGKIRIGFTVEKDGTVDDIHIIDGVATCIDQEAIRVVGTSPKWVPGRLYGVPIGVKFNQPMWFY